MRRNALKLNKEFNRLVCLGPMQTRAHTHIFNFHFFSRALTIFPILHIFADIKQCHVFLLLFFLGFCQPVFGSGRFHTNFTLFPFLRFYSSQWFWWRWLQAYSLNFTFAVCAARFFFFFFLVIYPRISWK